MPQHKIKIMKEQLGKQIKALRKECGVSTYALEKKGIHPSLPSTIEKGEKGYTIDSLLNYLNAIDEDIIFSVGKKVSNRWEKYCEVCGACNCKNNDSCIKCNCQF